MKMRGKMSWAGLAAKSRIAVAVVLIAGCAQEQDIVVEEPQSLPIDVSMRELMTGVLTPATNAIWTDSYAAELNDEDWRRLLEAAIQVSVGASAISMGGSDDLAVDSNSGPLATAEWQDWSRQLGDLARRAKIAAENRDQTAFAEAGDQMVEVCEACHTVHLAGAQ